jgi:hypothetical protein
MPWMAGFSFVDRTKGQYAGCESHRILEFYRAWVNTITAVLLALVLTIWGLLVYIDRLWETGNIKTNSIKYQPIDVSSKTIPKRQG